MNVDDLWKNIFSYSDYEKGGQYSASDIVGDLLAVKLRKDNPDIHDMKYEDKISAFIGSAIHQRAEDWLEKENAFGETNYEAEVKLKFKNISGTADLRIDGTIILDYKTGKETSIQSKIREINNKKDSSWQKQISIYTYLNHKQNKVEYGTIGYIAWLCTDSQKHGILEVELLPIQEVVKLLKDFLVAIEGDVNEMEKCNLCVKFKHRWCGVRSICPKWNADRNLNDVEDW